ncbi:MAG: MltA domain-containing protein, partial [Vitreoscilla sp.]|nr:MltA domain-containing protein [Polaromonas sp.]
MNTSSSSAPSASSNNKDMTHLHKWLYRAAIIGGAMLLASCAVRQQPLPTFPASSTYPAPPIGQPLPTSRADDNGPLPGVIIQAKSRWVPVRWADLPGFEDDALFEAWNAWLKSCERPGLRFAPLCGEARRLSIAPAEEQRAWMVSRLQPYRVESIQGVAEGLLTSYFEPLLKASRQSGNGYEVPLYKAPAGLGSRKPWFTRQEMDTLPEAQVALKGREIAYLADPIDVLLL